jgi:hypothetical protein
MNSNEDGMEPLPNRKRPSIDQAKQDLCTSMLKKILSTSSDLLFNVFFLSESLDSIASYASKSDPDLKFPRSAMIFTQQKSFDMSTTLADSVHFDKDLFSNPSYTVMNPSSVARLSLAFSSLLIAHPLKSAHHLTKIIPALKSFHGLLKGLCSPSVGALFTHDHLADTIGSVIEGIQSRGVECICRSMALGIYK